MEILIKNIMKTADVNKIFLAIFEKSYYDLYMHHFLWLQHVSIKSNDKGCNFALSTSDVILPCPPKKEL